MAGASAFYRMGVRFMDGISSLIHDLFRLSFSLFYIPCSKRGYEWLPVHCGDHRQFTNSPPEVTKPNTTKPKYSIITNNITSQFCKKKCHE